MRHGLDKVEVIILCGGKGTRLASVSGELPKALMPVAGRPFIDILLENLLQYGFRRFILSVGYRKDRIKEHFADQEFAVDFSEEETPLGTGGAVKQAAQMTSSPSFMVVNGDSICRTNYLEFFDFHVQKGGIMSMVLSRPQSREDCGFVEIDQTNRIVNFAERNRCRTDCLVNAGIYLMRRDILSHMPHQDRFSLEYDLFPKIVDLGCYGFLSEGPLVDIGTPERLERAGRILAVSQDLLFGGSARESKSCDES